MSETRCLSEDELIGYAGGRLAESIGRERVEKHVDTCSRCLAIVGGLARGSDTALPPWTAPPTPRLLAAGAVVASRYAIRRALGAGAMGEVYEAEDRLLGKTIALKTLNAVVAADPNALTRLRSEVALAHRVTHPNVCRIYDIGIDHGSPAEASGEPLRFLTMEFLDGQTLSAYLREQGALPVQRAYAILVQLAAALAAAHQVGVIHRDLKGDNVMLVEQPGGRFRAVVTDFGLAGAVPPMGGRLTGELVAYSGVSAHSAPEQLAGKPASPVTDVYSFGLLAYQVLTGSGPLRAPANAARLHESLDALTKEGADELAPRILWQRFLRQALHPDARRRWPNGAALETALLAMGPSLRSRGRRKLYALAAAALVGGAVVLLAARVQRQQDTADVREPAVVVARQVAQVPASVAAPTNLVTSGVDAAARSVTPAPHARRLPRADRALLARQLPTAAVAAPIERLDSQHAHRAADDIVRALPTRAPSLTSEADLADPFAARRAMAPTEE